MNPMVNLNLLMEKELELERKGMRRTRRYVGDMPRADAGLYKQRTPLVPVNENHPGKVDRVGESKSRDMRHSLLERLLQLSGSRHSSASSKMTGNA